MALTYSRLWLRGFVIVALTAWNVRHIMALEYPLAFAGGFGISLVWRWNARNAVQLDTFAADATYAIGAACGTVAGMWLGR